MTGAETGNGGADGATVVVVIDDDAVTVVVDDGAVTVVVEVPDC